MDEQLQSLIRTYEQAEYVVDPSGDGTAPFVLRVGQVSPDFDRWMLEASGSGVCWAFITAFNPGSQRLPEEVNRAAQRRLEARLAEDGFAYWSGWGQSPDGRWREESLLVRGMSRAKAVRLGREFGQVAVLFGEVGALAELVLCGTPAPSL